MHVETYSVVKGQVTSYLQPGSGVAFSEKAWHKFVGQGEGFSDGQEREKRERIHINTSWGEIDELKYVARQGEPQCRGQTAGEVV